MPPFVPVPRDASPIVDDPAPPPRQRRRLPLLGPLARWAEDPAVTDVLLDGAGVLWLDAGAGLVRAGAAPIGADDARSLAVSLVAAGGRHLDDAAPCVDVRLGDGVRVHAVLPPVSTGGTLVSVRLPRPAPWRLADLVERGAVGEADADHLREAVRDRRTLLVCGPAGSGKTSLLAALLAEAPSTDRIVTVEDVAELRIDHPHVVGLETRQPNADGAGGVGLTRLVAEALRMRPDRLVLGECRGAEVADLLAALCSGHDGGAGTLHASSLAAVPARLEALGALAGLGPAALARQVRSAVHEIVLLERGPHGRRLAAIGRPRVRHDRLTVEPWP